MSRVTVQMGHVARTSGATGTRREQEFTRALGEALAADLRGRGHEVALIGADQRVPTGDVFVALHCDGSTNTARRGGSVGYPDAAGQVLAQAWKRAHAAAGYPGGWLPDNYTSALRGYYGFGRAERAGGYEHRFLAEHGTTTNVDDETWLFDNVAACVTAHSAAIAEVVGHPGGPPPVTGVSTPVTQQPPHVHIPAFPGLTRLGMRNSPATRAFQQRFQQRGWPITVDGDHGPRTDQIMKSYQREKGLVPDGVGGPVTWRSLWTAPVTS